MATKTETQAPAVKTTTPKAKRAPVILLARLADQMKRGTLGGKLSKEDLEKIAALANSLQVFLAA